MNTIFKNLAGALSNIAPTLATMLGGPMAGTAITALEGAFGLSPGSGADAITKVVQTGGMTPEIIAAVRAADQKHAEIMGQQGIDLAKINADHEAAFITADVADKASARSMQIKAHSPWPGILSGLTTVAMLGAIGARFANFPLPQDPVTAQLIGTLQAGWIACLTYWVGSTRQSANNQNALVEIAKSQ